MGTSTLPDSNKADERWLHLRYMLEYVGLRIYGAIFGCLPVEFASWASGKLWRLIGPYLSDRHLRAINNLTNAYPEKSKAEINLIAGQMWENLGRIFAELFHLKTIANHHITIHNPEVFEDLQKCGKGAVFCGAHLANWEIAVQPLWRYKLRAASVYRQFKNPYVEKYIYKLRSFLYTGGLFAKDEHALRAITRHLKQGGSVAMLTDLRNFDGLNVDFFGIEAPSTPFPAQLAHITNTPLYVGMLTRRKGVKFDQYLEKIEIEKTGDRHEDVRRTTEAIHRTIEQSIRQNPAQWMWVHRRWG